MTQSAPISALGWMTAEGWMLFMSRVHQHESHFRFAHRFALDGANALRLADLAAKFGQFDIDHEHVTWTDRLSPFHAFSGDEISQLPEHLRLSQRENARSLRDRLQLQHARHDRMVRKMSL